MINEKDVITMKVPYPSVDSGLAVAAHMYICRTKVNSHCELVKCQTLKPSLISNNLMQHFVDELEDRDRNPFERPTRIDCDKLFVTEAVIYDTKMKTKRRPDVSTDLFNDVIKELNADGCATIPINEDELVNLNYRISKKS